MAEQIKLLLLIPHLGGGGAERVTALLAQHLDPQRFDVHLALITPDAPGANTPPPWVTVHRLNLRRVRQAWLPLLRLIRAERPDIVLSNMAHLNFLVLLLKPFLPRSTRVLVRQNSTASASALTRLTHFCYRHLYPCADAIVCQTQAMVDDLATHFAVPPDKLHVLPNPIDIASLRTSAAPPSPDIPHLLCVGRLATEKGLDLLLHALATLRATHPRIHLTMLGTGPEESCLRQIAQILRLVPAVTFACHANPADYYPTTTLYVQPSRHEGLPNALLEAAAAGLPIVATPCSEGLTELLQNAPGTWIAAGITADALTAAIRNALRALETQPPRYRHAFVQPYELGSAIAAYESLLLEFAKPRLALILPTIDQIGGAERQVLHLAQELALRGWQLTVITLSGSGGTEGANLIAQNTGFLSLQMRKGWVDPRGWMRYLTWSRWWKPDIVHAHLPHASWFARWMQLLAPAPLVIDTIHTSSTRALGRKLGYRISNALSDHVTCVSESVARAVLAAKMVTTSKLSIIHNGVPLPAVAPRRESDATFHWIAVGRLAHVKDYPTLLRAFAELPDRARLTIAGTGPEEPALKALAATLHLQDRVQFTGFQADIQPLLQQADAFVLASLWVGLPISVLEASAAGLPVVATDAAGTSEAMIPNETGLLVPVGDASALAAAMAEIMDMALKAREAMGNWGRQLVAEKFSLSAVADQWERLYGSLLEDKRARTRLRARSKRILPISRA